MKKLIFILLFIPTLLFGQSSNVRNVVTNGALTFFRGETPLSTGGVFYNVRDFGAVADSITDDAAAIQAAIDAIPEEGGTLFFPQGIYRIESSIKVTTAVHLLGVPVGMLVESQIKGADYWYNAGSVLMSKGAAKALIEVNTGRGWGHVEFRTPVIENLHFYDEKDYNDTLLVLRMHNYPRVYNCTFTEGYCGIKIDAQVEDASWGTVQDCNFRNNSFGIRLEADASAAGVPIVNIYGGNFLVKDNQVGIYGEKATYTTVASLKMDIGGLNAVGIDWGPVIHGGTNSSFTDIKFEMEGDDSTTIAIRTHCNSVSMSGIGVEGVDYGTGIWVQSGASDVDPGKGIAIVNSNFSGLDYGIIIDDTTAGVQVLNSNFNSNINKFNIKLRPNSGSHLISNTIIGDHFYNAISDSSTNSTFTNINYINGGLRRYYNIYPQETDGLTDGVPSDSELDSAFGFNAVQAGRGFRRTVRDTNGSGLLYIVESDGTNWFYIPFIKAL